MGKSKKQSATEYLLSSAKNKKMLMESIKQLKLGKTMEYSIKS